MKKKIKVFSKMIGYFVTNVTLAYVIGEIVWKYLRIDEDIDNL